MIVSHNIKGNILYLVIDFNYEFAKLGDPVRKKDFIKEIKRYIKEHNIKLMGGIIAFVVGGIVISSFNYVPNNNINYISDKTISHEMIDKLVDNEVVDDDSSNSDGSIDDNVSIVKPTISTPTPPTTNDIPQVNTVPEVDNELVDTKTYITLKRSSGTVETIELETYLIGVVGAEMPASFNSEALKTQAIVARTYALRKTEAGLVLTDTVSDQVYKDINQLKEMWGTSFDTYYNKIVSAVNATSCLVITYNNQLIDAVYHSTSNGFTVDSVDVWGNSVPYLQSVSSTFDTSASSFYKENTLSYDYINQKLATTLSSDSTIVTVRDINNRVISITIDDITFDGVDFRMALGLRSTDFELILRDGDILVTTKGYGHGVGMSQYGANGMANAGYSYSQIINHYYQGVKIVSH